MIASIESQLGGKAEFDWRPEGLVCCLSVPLSLRQRCRRSSAASQGSRRRPRLCDAPSDSLALEGFGSHESACSEDYAPPLRRRRPMAEPNPAPPRSRASGHADETASADRRRSQSSGDSDRKSSAVIPDIATTGRSGTRSRSMPIRSEPLVSCRKISTIARSKLCFLKHLQCRRGAGGLDDFEMVDPQHDGDHRAHIGLIVNNKNAGHQSLPARSCNSL